MSTPFTIVVARADGNVSDFVLDAFSATEAERAAARVLPAGDAVLLAAPFTD